MTLFYNGKNLWLYKGDTGNIKFSGLPTDKIYTAYLSVYDEDSERIIMETPSVGYDQTNGVAYFVIDEGSSNKLSIGEFTYALKLCANGSEDTVIPETVLVDGVYTQMPAPSFSVYAKRVEGE